MTGNATGAGTTGRSGRCAVVASLAFLLGLGTALAETENPPLAEVRASARILDWDGRELGELALEETPHGVLIAGELSGLPPGPHGFHIHERGRCEPPFESAGGHFAPDGRRHGIRVRGGAHRGDLTNVWADSSGRARVEILAVGVTLVPSAVSLFDADGAALVLHEGADDYKTDPGGAAGARIACGVIR